MSENSGETNVDADQVVVNQAPDGGGVDNEAEAPEPEAPESEDDSQK